VGVRVEDLEVATEGHPEAGGAVEVKAKVMVDQVVVGEAGIVEEVAAVG